MTDLSMRYITDKPKPKRKQSRRRPVEHIYNGFPHYSTTKIGHCICLDECCQSWDDGCICRTCPCRLGIPHGQTAKEEIEEINDKSSA